jgi:hypothetical protein
MLKNTKILVTTRNPITRKRLIKAEAKDKKEGV